MCDKLKEVVEKVLGDYMEGGYFSYNVEKLKSRVNPTQFRDDIIVAVDEVILEKLDVVEGNCNLMSDAMDDGLSTIETKLDELEDEVQDQLKAELMDADTLCEEIMKRAPKAPVVTDNGDTIQDLVSAARDSALKVYEKVKEINKEVQEIMKEKEENVA